MNTHAFPGLDTRIHTAAAAVQSLPEAAAADAAPVAMRERHAHRIRIPLHRIVTVELRKSFDTRAGRWLLVSVVGLAVLTTAAVIAFSPSEEFTYSNFTTAIAVPMGIVLPIIASLAVTAEWSQRSGLTTFTVVPDRGRVMLGKAIGVLVVAIPATALALAMGALGNVVASGISGHPAVWDQDVITAGPNWLLSIALTLMAGFAFGILIRNSAGAIVAFFVYSFVIPPILGLLAVSKAWFADVRPWIDLDHQTTVLQGGGFDAEQWQQLASAGAIWLVLPLLIGMWTLLRSEVK